MKKVATSIMAILLFSSLINAQTPFNSYKKLWEKVIKFQSESLPESALNEVEKIYELAKKENNTPQIIKALTYKSKYALTLEEDAQLNIINNFKTEISQNTFPAKNILESMLADLYWQYFQQNRWKFYNRTKTGTKVDSTDFRTWDLQTIFEETHTYYQNSLNNSLGLQQVDLKLYSEILIEQENSKKYRPTLYDFLVHRALDFYKNEERNITKPAYKFEISEESLLKNNQHFTNVIITSKDSLSQHLYALKLLKNLTLFHLKDSDPTALIDVTLDRLNFVKNNAVFSNKDSLFLATLKELKTTYSKHDTSSEIDFEIAKLFNEQANLYQPKIATENQFKRKEALEICEQAIANFPDSFGAKKCIALKNQILQKTLSITAEQYLPINKPSRLLINYKNSNKLYFTAYKIDRNQLKTFSKIYNDSARIAFLENLLPFKKWSANLKNEGDYQQHSTEILLPEFPHGNYLLIATPENEVLDKNKTIAYTHIQITNLALIDRNENGKYIYQVVNRNTGKPIANAKVNLKTTVNNRYNKLLNKNFVTDKNGEFSFKNINYYRNIVATVNYKKEKAVFGDYYLYNIGKTNLEEPDDKIKLKTFLFTDRSIYRPGQTVYFKVIVLKSQNDKTEVFTNEFIEISLDDPNGQEIKIVDLKLNEFGAVSGEFILPSGGLTGEYTIYVDEGSKYKSKFYDNTDFDFYSDNRFPISVEEYKRPKFETTFNPITETYKLNDSIKVSGSANAFAGSTISNANVTYRVVRTAHFPRWYGWYNRPALYSEEMEITHGTTKTDSNGNFNIKFKAIPDLKIPKENQPIFNYQVVADVTDINGETRSAETTVKVGYHVINATVTIDEKIDKTNSKNSIKINTENLNGEFVPVKGKLKIYKLLAPKNLLRERPWQTPDYQTFSEEEFRRLFPNDAYFDDETTVSKWKTGELVFEKNVDTKQATEVILGNISNWLSGNYKIIFECTDDFNQQVKDKQLFTVSSKRDKKVADNQLFFIQPDKSSYTPGESVTLKVGSASINLTATITIEKNHKTVATHFIHLNNEIKKIKIPVTQSDVGGFAVKYHFVNFNSFEKGNLTINVPYTKDDLEIETITFRDKLQPGSNQTWSFKIKDNKNEKVAAELLASMYDASLDEFKPHNWNFSPKTSHIYSTYQNSSARNSFKIQYFTVRNLPRLNTSYIQKQYDALNWFGFYFNNRRILLRGKNIGFRTNKSVQVNEEAEAEVIEDMSFVSDNNALEEVVVTAYGTSEEKVNEKISVDLSSVKIRKNFNETAFFYPHLTTDKDGSVQFNFTVPEALTKWKLQLLAHTKDAKSATETLTTVTQKELMVLPNPPRFLREGDIITFSSKISNLTDKNLNGVAQLQLTDAITGKEIDNLLGNTNSTQNFSVDAKGNTNVSWTLTIPKNIQAVQYKIIAKAGDFSDGEQNTLPVLSNRMLVTETLPMWIKSNETKTFSLDKLKHNTSTTLKNHKLTLEVTSNPAWYAVQALPYLMEFPYECSEQTFARYYANALATHIANSNPRIQEVFNQWKNSDALLSNLEKNQELKSLIIQETPWLRDAQSETEQKKRIALLFDLNKMSNELSNAMLKLELMQFANGGFPWFKGSNYSNRFITQHIASGFGHLEKLGVVNDNKSAKMIEKAVLFLDDEILADYNKLLEQATKIREQAKTKTEGLKAEKEFLAKQHIGYFQLQYLYMRSFYPQLSINENVKIAVEYYKNQSAEYWKNFNLYSKGLIALVQFRNGDKSISEKILKSLKENSITNEELGMYWKENTASWYWYRAPIETQALLIEAFSEIENDAETIDNLKIWLLKNKQTNRWKTTKATTEAIYALLLQGTNWLNVTDFIDIQIGKQTINPLALEEIKVEAGTGYFKTSFYKNEISPEMATVTLKKASDGIAWGALYWQYFEDLDKITSAETPLKLSKKLFIKKHTNKGEELVEITDKTKINLGDLVTVRIELKVDRVMEFVHMKDMRASGFEPINVLSQYKWQDGLGYYESTKDASTNFFFDYLPKGVYVFEYDLRVNNAGNFSNGITTIQSMYAPEFISHSEGIRVNME